MIYTTMRQLLAHERLLRQLTVRTVTGADAHEDLQQDAEDPTPQTYAHQDEIKRLERLEMPIGLIQRAEIRERRMLSIMRSGVWYRAKYLAVLAGIDEKTFYTYVRRMVLGGQLERSGRRHYFRYRKL